MKTQVCVFNKKSHPGEETDLNVLKPEQTLIKGPPEETDDPIVTQVPSRSPIRKQPLQLLSLTLAILTRVPGSPPPPAQQPQPSTGARLLAVASEGQRDCPQLASS